MLFIALATDRTVPAPVGKSRQPLGGRGDIAATRSPPMHRRAGEPVSV